MPAVGFSLKIIEVATMWAAYSSGQALSYLLGVTYAPYHQRPVLTSNGEFRMTAGGRSREAATMQPLLSAGTMGWVLTFYLTESSQYSCEVQASVLFCRWGDRLRRVTICSQKVGESTSWVCAALQGPGSGSGLRCGWGGYGQEWRQSVEGQEPHTTQLSPHCASRQPHLALTELTHGPGLGCGCGI